MKSLLLFLIAFLLLPLLGRTFEFNNQLFWQLRFPRVLMCLLAGGGLSVAGLVFQTMFRNDLATPFTLGTASGAALGAVIAISWGWGGNLPYWDTAVLMALLGGMGVSAFVYLLAEYKKSFDPMTLILVGVAVNVICASSILLIQLMGQEMNSLKIVHWLMGSVDTVGLESPLALMPFVLGGTLVVFFYARALNLMNVGNTFALTRGVGPTTCRKHLFLIVTLIVAPITAECGPIALVGLITPHVVKRWWGRDHRFLIVPCFLGGGLLLGLCDLVSRILIEDILIPVGVITSLLGGPFFLWVLFREKNINTVDN